jgi:DNA-binding transcriptional regulator YdaS (Cro superfamily)
MTKLGPCDPGYRHPHRVPSPHAAFERALVEVGGAAEMARRLKRAPSAIQKWARLGRIPAERVLEIERATSGQVTRYELRPDLYPKEP